MLYSLKAFYGHLLISFQIVNIYSNVFGHWWSSSAHCSHPLWFEAWGKYYHDTLMLSTHLHSWYFLELSRSMQRYSLSFEPACELWRPHAHARVWPWPSLPSSFDSFPGASGWQPSSSCLIPWRAVVNWGLPGSSELVRLVYPGEQSPSSRVAYWLVKCLLRWLLDDCWHVLGLTCLSPVVQVVFHSWNLNLAGEAIAKASRESSFRMLRPSD